MQALLETWAISHRMNEYLLAGIDERHFPDTPIAKGRSVGAQFAHLHNVRLMWVKAAAPQLMEGLPKLEKEVVITKQVLLEAFAKSTAAIATLLQLGLETGRIKGFKPHPEAFLGYLIAHEAHHRGQIILTLKENGHMPDKKVLFGLWEWGTK